MEDLVEVWEAWEKWARNPTWTMNKQCHHLTFYLIYKMTLLRHITKCLSTDTNVQSMCQLFAQSVIDEDKCCDKLLIACLTRQNDMRVMTMIDSLTPLAFPSLKVDDIFDVELYKNDSHHILFHKMAIHPLTYNEKVYGHIIGCNVVDGCDFDRIVEYLSSLIGTKISFTESHDFFLSTMTHEIRTPLCGIIGMARLLQNGGNLVSEQKNYVDVIYRCGFQLLEMINDILDYTKLNTKNIKLENTYYNIRDAIQESREVVFVRALEKHLQLTCDIEPNVPVWVCGDRKRYKQIVINLLSNAIKFTERGSVMCRVFILNSSLIIRVTDTGIGMDAKDHNRIFDTFVQLNTNSLTGAEGMGLGLAICKKLVTIMGGTICVLYSKVGEGTCMEASTPIGSTSTTIDDSSWEKMIPKYENKRILIVEPNLSQRLILSNIVMKLRATPCLCTSVEEAQLYIANKRDVIDLVLLHDGIVLQNYIGPMVCINQNIPETDILFKLSSVNITTGAPKLIVAPSAEQDLSILVAEDNEYNMMVAVETLKKLGYTKPHVQTAVNGLIAYQLCERYKFHIIFMDLKMPVMDGITATRKILSTLNNGNTSIIAMTAFVMGQERHLCKQAGMKGFLAKPIIINEMKMHLDAVKKRPVK